MTTEQKYKHALNLHYANRFEESQKILLSILDKINPSEIHRVYFNIALNAKFLKQYKTSREFLIRSIDANRSYFKAYAALHELYSYNYEWRNGFRFYDYNYAFDLYHYNYDISKSKRLDWDDPHVQRALSIKFDKDISKIRDASDIELDYIYANALKKVKNKVIHVIATQGLGDVIQASKLVLELLAFDPKKIILSVSKEVVRLFGELDDRIEVCCQRIPPDEYDYFIPMMSLIKLFKSDETPSKAWLSIRELDDYFAGEMIKCDHNKINIGINWRGNPLHINDSKRSMTLDKMIKEMGDITNCVLYSFQFKPTDEERALMEEHNIKDLSPLFTDMYGMGMYLMHMTMLITIDSAPLHLAGALGVRTFGMIPDGFEDWRWGNTKENVLYDSLSLIRFKV